MTTKHTELLTGADVSREAIQHGDPLTPAGVRLAGTTGKLPIAALTPRGQRLYARADVERWLAERAAKRAEREAA